jgi:transporter family-2 protein
MFQVFVGIGLALLAVGAGVSFVFQQVVNFDLRMTLDSAAWAGFVSYLGGTLCMLIVALALREDVPSVAAIARSNWWAWSGGFFGAIYIGVSILLVPRLGTATLVALLVGGQMLSALLLTISVFSASLNIQRSRCACLERIADRWRRLHPVIGRANHFVALPAPLE